MPGTRSTSARRGSSPNCRGVAARSGRTSKRSSAARTRPPGGIRPTCGTAAKSSSCPSPAPAITASNAGLTPPPKQTAAAPASRWPSTRPDRALPGRSGSSHSPRTIRMPSNDTVRLPMRHTSPMPATEGPSRRDPQRPHHHEQDRIPHHSIPLVHMCPPRRSLPLVRAITRPGPPPCRRTRGSACRGLTSRRGRNPPPSLPGLPPSG